jgi:Ca2+-dependent lipid-binding protein
MSSLQSSEGTQVNEGAEAFSKLESEIGELVRRDTTAPRLQQGNDDELNVGSLVNTQVNDGVDVFSKLEGEIREHVGSMVQKVSGTSVQEVENLVTEQRPSGASNSSLESRERTQVDEGVGVFSKLEGEIREHVGSVMQKVSGTSVQEVENLIAELQILRGKLQNEAARVQREIRDYAVLIQGAKKSITTISGSLSFWKDRDAPKISA